MDDFNVIVSDMVRRQLEACVAFIAKDNEEAAQRLRARLVAGIRSLSAMPNRYPFFNEPYIPHNKYHKMYIEKYYLILYQIMDTTVYVDYAVDCRRDYFWLLR